MIMNSQKVLQLVELISKAATAYYNSDTPIMSDFEFDMIIEELRNIDPENAILTKPDFGAVTEYVPLKKHPHKFKVTGIPWKIKRHELDGVLRDKIKGSLIVSEKLDGITAVVYYRDGKLERILTRNDGVTGLDITHNLRHLVDAKGGIRDTIGGNVEWVRGEVVTSWDACTGNGYSHPRNMASGLSTSKDVTENHNHLQFIAFDISMDTDKYAKFIALERFGFRVPENWIVYDPFQFPEVEKRFNISELNYRRDDGIPTDGLVLDTLVQDIEPLVVKYQSKAYQTEVQEVVPQVSNYGRVIPVIKVNPVNVDGCVITYCSGFNYENIKKNHIGKGAIIEVTRANEVIPYWSNTISPAEMVEIPEEIDGSRTTWQGVDLRVEVDKLSNAIFDLINRKAPIGLGSIKVEEFIEHLEIVEFDDIASIINRENHDELVDMVNRTFSDAYIPKILELVENMVKGYTLSELLTSSFSDGLGKVAAQTLQDIFDNCPIKMLMHIKQNNGISPEVSSQMPTYLVAEGIKNNLDLLLELLDANIRVLEVKSKNLIKVCVTGDVSLPRKKWFEKYRDSIVEVTIAKADYLVANKDDNSSKVKTANKKGIPIITEQEILNMIGGKL